MKMLAPLLALAGASMWVAPAAAQDRSNAEVLASVDAFLHGLNTKDPAAIAAVSASGGTLVSHRTKDGKDAVRIRTFADDLSGIAKEKGKLREIYWDPSILVQGNIAVVWAPYSFDYDGKRTHCGIDVFNLMKIDGAWKVTGIQYTVEPDNCPKGR
jgi:hypothetical protein